MPRSSTTTDGNGPRGARPEPKRRRLAESAELMKREPHRVGSPKVGRAKAAPASGTRTTPPKQRAIGARRARPPG